MCDFIFDAIQAIARNESTKFVKFRAAAFQFSTSGVSLKLKWAYK